MVIRLYSENTDKAQKAVADDICDYLQDFEVILNLSTNLWRSWYAAARCTGAVYASRLGNGFLRQDTFDPGLTRIVLHQLCRTLSRVGNNDHERSQKCTGPALWIMGENHDSDKVLLLLTVNLFPTSPAGK